MKADKDLFRLEHIIDSIGKIEELTRLLHSYDNFEKKWIEQDALIRNFEIIGETSVHVSQGLKDAHPHVVWNEMKGLRNFITHEYFGLQLDSIWYTAIHDIPMLKWQVQTIIDSLR